MALLQHKLAHRSVLKYQLDISVMEDEEAEFEVLLVVKIGEDGLLTTEYRLQNRSGPFKLPERFSKPGEYRLQPGQPLPPFLPQLPDREIEKGDLWTGQDSGHPVFYEMTSLNGSVAEIVSRKVVEKPRSETEGLYEFDLARGRVVLAQTVTENKSGRVLAEYELQDD